MIDAIPAELDALETWLVDSGGQVAVSNAGLSLLQSDGSPGSDEQAGSLELLRALREG